LLAVDPTTQRKEKLSGPGWLKLKRMQTDDAEK